MDEPPNEVTQILNGMQQGDAESQDRLLPAVYEELRRMARQKMAGEAPGHTLQPTALVHEAWMRLSGQGQQNWKNRAHFFAAAAESMRRILVEHARRRLSLKRGAGAIREELDESTIQLAAPAEELLAIHEEIDRLAERDPEAAELVKLRYFVGMTMEEAAAAMNLAPRTAERIWTYARVWLRDALRK